MIALAALCLAGALGVALAVLLVARAMGWRRRRIAMLVRPWLLIILVVLTIGLAAEAWDGVAEFPRWAWTIGGAWLVVSLSIHLIGHRSGRDPSRRWGAIVAHAGIVVAFGSLAFSTFGTSTVSRAMKPGDIVQFGAWTLELHDVWPAAGGDWTGVAAELRASSGAGMIEIEPELRDVIHGPRMAHPATADRASGTLTATLGPSDAEGRWPIALRWTPLVVLMPIGLAMAAVGLLIAVGGPPILRWRRLRQARLASAWWA